MPSGFWTDFLWVELISLHAWHTYVAIDSHMSLLFTAKKVLHLSVAFLMCQTITFKAFLFNHQALKTDNFWVELAYPFWQVTNPLNLCAYFFGIKCVDLTWYSEGTNSVVVACSSYSSIISISIILRSFQIKKWCDFYWIAPKTFLFCVRLVGYWGHLKKYSTSCEGFSLVSS